jgi:hypothetical protein
VKARDVLITDRELSLARSKLEWHGQHGISINVPGIGDRCELGTARGPLPAVRPSVKILNKRVDKLI